MTSDDVRAAATRAARTSYGRMVAVLASASGDIALAEDALADAFERALTVWPVTGVPAHPEGWLITVARNRIKDVWKSAAHRRQQTLDSAIDVAAGSPIDDLDPDAIPDRRLELLFACAHPAIDPAARTPLMLQVVLGFEAADIARLHALSPAALAQRLVRAKRRIKHLRIPFRVPDQRAMPERLPAVLDAIYGCYTLASAANDAEAMALAAEAGDLADLLAGLLRSDPEAWGLSALIALSRARRRDPATEYVPLDEQDPSTWDAALIDRGETALRRASALAVAPGRFQLEAALQSVYCARRHTGRTDWSALNGLYRALLVVAPTLGARVAYAGVVLRLDGPHAALALLDGLAEESSGYQPWYAVRAEALRELGRLGEARVAYERALELSDSDSIRAFLQARRDRLR